VACLCHSVDETQRALLYHSSSTSAVSHKVNYEQALAPLEFWKSEFFLALAIIGFIELKLAGNCALKPVEVDT